MGYSLWVFVVRVVVGWLWFVVVNCDGGGCSCCCVG